MALTEKDRARIKATVKEITERCRDRGQIIEGGWQAMKVLYPALNPGLEGDMRRAFFAGAQHLFASVLNLLDPGSDATERDMETMSIIHEELDRFVNEEKDRLGWQKT